MVVMIMVQLKLFLWHTLQFFMKSKFLHTKMQFWNDIIFFYFAQRNDEKSSSFRQEEVENNQLAISINSTVCQVFFLSWTLKFHWVAEDRRHSNIPFLLLYSTTNIYSNSWGNYCIEVTFTCSRKRTLISVSPVLKFLVLCHMCLILSSWKNYTIY